MRARRGVESNSSLRFSLLRRGLGVNRTARLGSGEIDVETLHADGAFHSGAVEGAGKDDVRGRTLERGVDGERGFVGAVVAADDVGIAARAAERAGKRAVAGHGDIGGGFFRSFRSGVR